MSCAHHLAEHPDKFSVTLVDAVSYCGGQAFSIPLDKEKQGASWMNQGVQGGSYIFHHTMAMFARNGYCADPVKLQVSFGKDDTFWTNVYPTKLLEKHQKEIQRFYKMLKVVRWFEVIFALIPLKLLMKLWGFSTDFTNMVALPMVALFLGTGNFTPEVPTIMLERLCTSPTYGMWYPPDKQSIASNLPPMVVFPNLSEFYNTWRKGLEKRGVDVRLNTEVTRVVKRGRHGVVVQVKSADTESEQELQEEVYDELVLCVQADTAKRILATEGSFLEKRILGSCKWANDITVTHYDGDYIKKHYDVEYNPDQAVQSLSGVDQKSRVEFAEKQFSPMYLVKTQDQDRSKLDLCFDCTNYQGQFPPSLPYDKHVFQTIFLNKERDGHLWSIDEIDESKIIRKDWWHQLCHSWTHYAFVVPWLWLIQGRRRTRFAASWTLVNAHEVACISGIAAAVNLGAIYPHDLERDKFAFLAFRLFYLFQYRSWYRRKADPEGTGKDWASGLYGSVYQGPGVAHVEKSIWKEEHEAGRSL
jgi:predicted NAD/FAD-binding protein